MHERDIREKLCHRIADYEIDLRLRPQAMNLMQEWNREHMITETVVWLYDENTADGSPRNGSFR